MPLRKFQTTFNASLAAYLSEKRSEMQGVVDDDTAAFVVDSVIRVVQAGGKRLRPYIASLMYRTAGGKDVFDIMPQLIGIELLHAFCLVHDDIMDRSHLRHGVPTVQAAMHDYIQEQYGFSEPEHAAQSQAILAGDLLFAWASHALTAGITDPSMQAKVVTSFMETVQEVVTGQILDVDFTVRPTVMLEDLERRNLLKTARYSVVRPLLLGAILAGKDADYREFCYAFGEPVGLAYQIQDDILDLTGAEADVHKSTRLDLAARQHTYLTQFVRSHGTPAQKVVLDACFNGSVSEAVVQVLFEESGAIDHARHLVVEHFEAAKDQLDAADFSDERRQEWNALLETIQNRTS